MAKKPAAPKPAAPKPAAPKPDASVDPQLKQEVHEAAEDAKPKQPGIVSINANLDPDQIHLRDSRSE